MLAGHVLLVLCRVRHLSSRSGRMRDKHGCANAEPLRLYASGVSNPREVLKEIAWQAMRDRGFEPDYPATAIAQAREPRASSPRRARVPPRRRDLRDRLWCSIDNEESRDLDQLTVAEGARTASAFWLPSQTSTRWSHAILRSIATQRRTRRPSTRPLKCLRCCRNDCPQTSPRLPRA